MRRYNLEGIHGGRVDTLRGIVSNPVVLASSCFALGLAAGLMLKGRGSQMYRGALNALWHRDYERTVEYDENLPESLTRREPAPHPAQPRFGGTGALGVSPAAAVPARPGDSDR